MSPKRSVSKSSKSKPAKTIKLVDLFAGIGGMRLAFESVGAKCVFSSEWDKYCQKTYEAILVKSQMEI